MGVSGLGRSDHVSKVTEIPEIKKSFKYNFRQSYRADVRPKEGIEGWLHLPGGISKKIRIYDLSNSGASVVLSEGLSKSLKPLDNLSLTIRILDQEFKGEYNICWFENFGKDQKRLGLKLNYQSTSSELKIRKMVEIPDDFPVVGYFYQTHTYYERCAFRLIAISADRAVLEVLSSHTLLFPGHRINLLFSLDTISSSPVRAKVVTVSAKERKLILVVELNNIDKNASRSLVNHLLIHSDISLVDLRNCGFRPRNISNNFSFRYARDQREYEKVLELRRKAYRAHLKIDATVKVADMAAPLDHISRIMTVYQGGPDGL